MPQGQTLPEIFLKHLAQATEDTQESEQALLVNLSDNFRSRKGLLDFFNTVIAIQR